MKAILVALCAAFLWVGGSATRAEDSKTSLIAQKEPLERRLGLIADQRLAFERYLSREEERCLDQFFSAHCLERLRTEYLERTREFDLQREETLQAIRDIDAQVRAIHRAQRIDERNAKQPAVVAPKGGS
jgi:hypothetical protein